MNRSEKCGATLSIRIPDAPVDDWDTATCIQTHDRTPAKVGTVHNSGDGTRWVELDGFVEVAPLMVDASELKVLREMLCIHQAQWSRDGQGYVERSRILGDLIAEIDRHRPLGPDGKHGVLHTTSCGCPDDGPADE